MTEIITPEQLAELLNIAERRRVIIEQANDVFLQLKNLGIIGENIKKEKILSIVFDTKKQKQIASLVSFANAEWIDNFTQCKDKTEVELTYNPYIDFELGF